MKRVLTIQDISCVGQCSLTVALPLISACGLETAILPSAVLSTHTAGFKGYTFRDLTDDMAAIEKHWVSENIKFDAFYTGYVCPSQIEPILSVMKNCANEGALRIVDPVMGDNGKLYPGFGADFPDIMKRLCDGADCIVPNLTESALMLHEECCLSGYDQQYIESTLKKLLALGAKSVVLTGVSFEADKLGIATYDGKEIRYYFNRRLDRMTHGTGDVYASVFTGALVRGVPLHEAASLAADFVCHTINATPDEHWYGVCFEQAIPELVKAISKL